MDKRGVDPDQLERATLLARPSGRFEPAVAVFIARSVRSCQKVREWRISIEHTQHFVAAAIRHFEQHTMNTGFPVRREYRLVCRCVEYCY
jgi:hypothetical protein